MLKKAMVAKILLSDSTSIQNIITINLEKLGITKNSPDVLYFDSNEKLGIEQIRKIRDFLSIKSYSSKGRTVVLENGENLTIEAQNALLKSLEELSDNNLFLIGATSEASFLPTILSRCEIIRGRKQEAGSKNGGQEQEIEKLLDSTIEERFEYIEKLKDKELFLHALVAYFHKHLASHLKSGNVNFLREFLETEQWAKQNVNIRAILEYLMLKMPIIQLKAQS